MIDPLPTILGGKQIGQAGAPLPFGEEKLGDMWTAACRVPPGLVEGRLRAGPTGPPSLACFLLVQGWGLGLSPVFGGWPDLTRQFPDQFYGLVTITRSRIYIKSDIGILRHLQCHYFLLGIINQISTISRNLMFLKEIFNSILRFVSHILMTG